MIFAKILQVLQFANSKLYTTNLQQILQILQQKLQICKQVCKIEGGFASHRGAPERLIEGGLRVRTNSGYVSNGFESFNRDVDEDVWCVCSAKTDYCIDNAAIASLNSCDTLGDISAACCTIADSGSNMSSRLNELEQKLRELGEAIDSYVKKKPQIISKNEFQIGRLRRRDLKTLNYK